MKKHLVSVLFFISGCVTAKTPLCETSGCNGEICSEKGQRRVSPCVILPQHECLKKSKCEPQESGKCGWTKTPEYDACMKRFQLPQK
jgi:hypothetical protein